MQARIHLLCKRKTSFPIRGYEGERKARPKVRLSHASTDSPSLLEENKFSNQRYLRVRLSHASTDSPSLLGQRYEGEHPKTRPKGKVKPCKHGFTFSVKGKQVFQSEGTKESARLVLR